MTDKIDEIEARWAKATQVPWIALESDSVGFSSVVDADAMTVAEDVLTPVAEAIAAAPTDIAALLAEVKRLRAGVASLAAEARPYAETGDCGRGLDNAIQAAESLLTQPSASQADTKAKETR